MTADRGLHLGLQLRGIVATDDIGPDCVERMPRLRLLLKPRKSKIDWPADRKHPSQQVPEDIPGPPVLLNQLLCLQTTDSWLLQRLQAPR